MLQIDFFYVAVHTFRLLYYMFFDVAIAFFFVSAVFFIVVANFFVCRIRCFPMLK